MTTEPAWVWTSERLVSCPTLGELQLASDGQQILYALRERLLTDEKSRLLGHLCVVSTEGGIPLPLTYSPHDRSSRRWSPSGTSIAFLSDGQGGPEDLYAMRIGGGQAWAPASLERSVQAVEWAPNGSQLTHTAPPADSGESKADRKDRRDPERWGLDHDRAQSWVLPFPTGGDPLAQPHSVTPPHTAEMTVGSEDGWGIDALAAFPLGYAHGTSCQAVVIVHGGQAGAFSETPIGDTVDYYRVAALAERACLRRRGGHQTGELHRHRRYPTFPTRPYAPSPGTTPECRSVRGWRSTRRSDSRGYRSRRTSTQPLADHWVRSEQKRVPRQACLGCGPQRSMRP